MIVNSKIRRQTGFFFLLIFSLHIKAQSSSSIKNGNNEAITQLTESVEINDSTSIPTYHQLEDLVIEASLPIVITDGSTLTYNVDEDPSSKSSNLLDLLRKVPLVTVSGNDEIKLNGSSEFKILLNGHEEPMLTQNASMIFKNLPASTVANIEVITDPGAKYDAEGVGGILNIITERKQKKGGYNGQLSASYSTDAAAFTGYTALNFNNVNLSANVTYANDAGMAKTNEKEGFLEYHDNKMISRLNTQSREKFGFDIVMANLSGSWEPNEKNLFSMNLSFSDFIAKSKLYQTLEKAFSPIGSFLYSTNQNYNIDLTKLNLSSGISYQHNFKPKNNYLVLSYLFTFGNQDLKYNGDMYMTENYTPEYRYTSQCNNTFSREHTVQGDYVIGLGSYKHLIETGIKGIFRNNSAFGSQKGGNNTSNITTAFGSNEITSQTQNIYAAYISYTGNYGPFSSRIGIRYEYSDMEMKYRMQDYNEFSKSLNDIVPNASFSYKFNNNSLLRLAYKMRITRPSIEQVNPFILDTNNGVAQTGNPDLQSERNNSVSLTFSKFARVLGGNVGVKYSNTSNVISQITKYQDNLLIYTQANIGRTQNIGFSGFLNWNIISNMSLSINGRLSYDYLHSPALGLSNHGWKADINGNWNYSLSPGWRFGAYGGYSTKTILLQGSYSGWNYIGISASKDLLKNKSLNIGLNATNFYTDRKSFIQDQSTAEVTSRFITKYRAWNVGVSLTWKFGNSNNEVKTTDASILNDDIVKTKSQNPGEL